MRALAIRSIHPGVNHGNGSSSIDLKGFKDYLDSHYSESTVKVIFAYCRKYQSFLTDPSKILLLPDTIRNNVIKSLNVLGMYSGSIADFKYRCKQNNVKCLNVDGSLKALNRMLSNQNGDLLKWFKEIQTILKPNEQLWSKFLLATGKSR